MKIYNVIEYVYNGDAQEVDIRNRGAFKTREIASAYMKKIARKYYQEWFDENDYEFKEFDNWCKITNEEYVDYDRYEIWWTTYEVKECEFFDNDLIIQNN